MANTRKLKRKNNKSRRKYLKKRGGSNTDLSNLFMNSNPLVRISQMAGITH
jgi:hypothetical protein